jgi:mono/diheme cytochrome c family protein
MIARLMSRGGVVVLTAACCAAASVGLRAQSPAVGTEAQRQAGQALYLKYCSQCHGEHGDGEGYAAVHLRPRPRDFTRGLFKVRTTPNGALPTHQDLVNVIRRGMPYTSMPAWPVFTDEQVSDLAYFVTTFSPEFAKPENVPHPVPLPSAPRTSDETIDQGKKLYVDTGCVKCHGPLGRGDGPSAPTLKDDWGHAIRAADLTQPWTFRGGPTREDIFRTMSTGFSGTPMPSFSDALTPEQRWALTDYISSLSGTTEPGYSNLVVARHVAEPIDLARGAAGFAAAPVARFPIVGQIMQPGRSFHPPATSVDVQAIWDGESIAVLVRWHDMSAQTSGTNGPSLAVPAEEAEEPAAAPADAGGGVFGDAEVQAPPAGQPQDPFAEPEAVPANPPSEFSDAVAIQIPAEVPTGARKPYFIFGDADDPVHLWFFDLARSEPAQFTAKGSGDITPANAATIAGVAGYDQGEWSVIFKRSLASDWGAAFTPGQFMPIAFSVWDGYSRERGNRRGLTPWYSLYVEPAVVPSAVGPMFRTAFVILALELAVLGWVRRGSRIRAAPRDDQRPQPATSA